MRNPSSFFELRMPMSHSATCRGRFSLPPPHISHPRPTTPERLQSHFSRSFVLVPHRVRASCGNCSSPLGTCRWADFSPGVGGGGGRGKSRRGGRGEGFCIWPHRSQKNTDISGFSGARGGSGSGSLATDWFLWERKRKRLVHLVPGRRAGNAFWRLRGGWAGATGLGKGGMDQIC